LGVMEWWKGGGPKPDYELDENDVQPFNLG